MNEILDALARIERLLEQTVVQQNAVTNAVTNAVLQKKEASSLPPQCPPKEDEKRSKKEEENNPPLSPLFLPEENLCVQSRAREEMQELEASFDAFWEAYGYKRNRREAWKVWKSSTKMSKKDREAAMAGVEAYKADCERFERPMCHASTYLNQRRWEDDFKSGLENADRKNGIRNIFTREDYRRREREQRMQDYVAVAEEFRSGSSR